MRALFFIFVLFPLLELALLIAVGSHIGVLATLLLVIASALAGSLLLRSAGLVTALRAREQLAHGEMPEQAMLDGLMLALAGGLLLLPGLISDALALLCLLPVTRRSLLARLRRAQVERAERQRAFFDDPQARASGRPERVIEGEFQRRD